MRPPASGRGFATPSRYRSIPQSLPPHAHAHPHPAAHAEPSSWGSLATGWIIGIPLGIFFGYCAGTLTAGVLFWFMERRKLQAATRVLPDIELHPFTAADLATLIEWMRNDSLAEQLGRFAVHASARTAAITGSPGGGGRGAATGAISSSWLTKQADLWWPTRNWAASIARLGPPPWNWPWSIRPRPQRAAFELLQLLRTVIGRAFGDLQLLRLGVLLPDDRRRTLGCYRAAGFCELGHEPAVYRLEVVSTAGL